MHRAQLMQHPQGVAQLPGDFPRFGGGEQRALQKVGKRIPLYVFFQHRHHTVPLRSLHNLRQVWAGDAHQLPVDLPISAIMAKNKACSVLFVLQKRNTAALAMFDRLYGFIVRFDA